MSWSKELLALYRERYLMGLTVSGHPLAVLRPWLQVRGFVSATGLRSLATDAPVAVAGEVVIVHTPPQRSKKRVIFATIEDETGLVDLALFPHAQGHARTLLAHPLILAWGRLSRRGEKDGLVVVSRVAPPPIALPGRRRAAPRGL